MSRKQAKSLLWKLLLFLIVAILFLSVSFSLPAEPKSGETNRQVFLIGFSDDRTNSYDYWIDSDRLPSKVVWEAGKEAFPVALEVEIRRASDSLTQKKQLTNALKLQEVSMQCLTAGQLSSSEPPRTNAFPNSWIVALVFREQPKDHIIPWMFHRVVMLLDGAYASERIRKLPLKIQIATPKPDGEETNRLFEVAGENLSLAHKPSRKTHPLHLVRQVGFRVPETQWDQSSPFPLDFKDAIPRTHTQLVQRAKMPQEFVLTEIEMLRYTPVGAVPDDLTRILHHQNHWILRFTFVRRPGGGMQDEYESYMLLDGEILGEIAPGEY